MDVIIEPIVEIWEGFLANPIVQLASQLIVIYVVLLWLGTAYWAFRDMQARTENPILPYFAAALIIFFTPLLFVFAVVLYLIVRPRETLAEVYERSLAEESLLAEVEKNAAPGKLSQVLVLTDGETSGEQDCRELARQAAQITDCLSSSVWVEEHARV
jgi:hypothetical protein